MRILSGVCGDREGVSLQRPGLAPRLSSSSLCLDTLCHDYWGSGYEHGLESVSLGSNAHSPTYALCHLGQVT